MVFQRAFADLQQAPALVDEGCERLLPQPARCGGAGVPERALEASDAAGSAPFLASAAIVLGEPAKQVSQPAQ